eukprot:scaffold1588_cov78-Phaeocystis_antarctica.AAC.1
MVSHTCTRLVCYAIPRFPGPSHPDTKEKGKGDSEEEKQRAQHRAFPRGPPPQYYPGSNLLNFAARMGSGEPG